MSEALYYSAYLAPACAMAREAGERIMTHYHPDVETQIKDDRSPVTVADMEANAYIVEQLAAMAPDIAIVSEEGDKPDVSGQPMFWLVDPLDGTKSFIRGTGEFTVNVALVEDGVPVLGVIYLPATRVLYWGSVNGGAFRQKGDGQADPITTRAVPEEGLSAVVSHSHLDPKTEAFLAPLKVAKKVSAASSLKFCRVAEGSADLYPRFGPTMEWDTAAGHAIVLAAGGRVETPEGEAFTYGRPDFRNGAFVCFGR